MFLPTSSDDIKEWIKVNGLKDTNDLVWAKTAQYMWMVVNGAKVGFTGVITYENKLISQAQYVMPDHRGNGYFKTMLDLHENMADQLGVKAIEATCTDMSLREYLNRGFRPVKSFKKYVKVCKAL